MITFGAASLYSFAASVSVRSSRPRENGQLDSPFPSAGFFSFLHAVSVNTVSIASRRANILFIFAFLPFDMHSAIKGEKSSLF
jgi:hypothetical protein